MTLNNLRHKLNLSYLIACLSFTVEIMLYLFTTSLQNTYFSKCSALLMSTKYVGSHKKPKNTIKSVKLITDAKK